MRHQAKVGWMNSRILYHLIHVNALTVSSLDIYNEYPDNILRPLLSLNIAFLCDVHALLQNILY